MLRKITTNTTPLRQFTTSAAQHYGKSRSKPLDTTQFKKNASFDRNFPQRPQKAWERAGQDKDTFFRTKYAHVHAQQIKNRNEDPAYLRHQQYKLKEQEEKQQQQQSRQTTRSRRRLGDNYVESFSNPLSEFVYGTSAVLAALEANKRVSYARLLLQGTGGQDDKIVQLAKQRGIYVEQVDKHRLNILSNYNPHNGVVLETRPLELSELKKLGPVINNRDLQHTEYEVFEDELGGIVEPVTKQVVREKILLNKNANSNKINGTDEVVFNPFGVFIDEVTDPYNLGAIIRSAYFLGADFVVVTAKNSAPLNGVVAKASSGALELVDLYVTHKPMTFMLESQANGWRFVSAGVTQVQFSQDPKASMEKAIDSDSLKDLLTVHPCILVLGSEGKGIRKNILSRSDYVVLVESYREDVNDGSSVVDSLNVSVAGSLLMHQFLHGN